MSEFQDTEDTESNESEEESPVLREVRARERAAQKELAELRAKMEAVETAKQSQREEAAENIMNSLGLPGLKDDVLGWVEDVNEASIRAVLEAKSIPLPDGNDTQPESSKPDNRPVSEIAQKVADSAAGRDGRSLDERIAQAESPSELKALMDEAGLSRSHH